MNIELLRKVQEKIKAEPESLDMGDWGYKNKCGTAACICGWALLLSDNARFNRNGSIVTGGLPLSTKGAGVLDISLDQANRLFHINNWPAGFRDDDTFEPINPIGRIDHFIATEGRE